jgi:hypothetical protein
MRSSSSKRQTLIADLSVVLAAVLVVSSFIQHPAALVSWQSCNLFNALQ